ncbi:MAG: flavodoxin domain-containing protein [Chloroflexota bacterium]
MKHVLIVYASPHGSTADIAIFMGRLLQVYDTQVTVLHADDVESVAPYDAFILGSAIHSSMWLPSLSRFMFRFAETLAEKPVFLYLVCIIALEQGGAERAITEFVWQEALDKINIPKHHRQAFAGRLDWERITGDEEWIIKGTYKGQQLNEIASGDYRDWETIAGWIHKLASALALSPVTDDAIPTMQGQMKRVTRDETITKEGVRQLKWLDNPGEVAPI